MNARGKKILSLVVVSALSFILLSCASGPTPPAKGTPAFYWQAARETFAAGDYTKANDHLDSVCRTDNEFTARAQPWKLVLATGMAKGFIEMADNFEFGSRANRANPTPFRKETSKYRTFAGQLALQAGETLHKFQDKNKDPKIVLEFNYPTGSAAFVQSLTRISQGALVQQSEVEDIQKKVVERAVLLSACAAVGAPEDTAKTQSLFQAGKVEVPRETFLFAAANAMFEISKVYARDKLDDPNRLKILLTEALQALKEVPESKKTKDLKARIEKAMKAAKIS